MIADVLAATWRYATKVTVQLDTKACTLKSVLHALELPPAIADAGTTGIVPLRFVFTNKLSKDERMLLAFDALIVSKSLKQVIEAGKLIHGDHGDTTRVNISSFLDDIQKRIKKIIALLSSSSPPELVLNRHCMECEFEHRCRQKATEADDLSLLSGMSDKERARHRSKGIFTVTQLSYTFRPRRTPKRAKNPAKPHHFALQALAIRENTTYIHGTPELPKCVSRVYLDIEGLPDRNLYYLIGALIVTDGQESFHSFWADTESDQASIFLQFAEAISGLHDFRVFHFGDYDAAAMKRVAPNLPGKTQRQFEAIIQKSTNVLSLIYPHIYFPTFSNSLKDLGAYLGCKWLAHGARGLESIIWRNEWEGENSPDLKTRLLDYNRTDCVALEALTAFMVENVGSNASEEGDAKVKRTDHLRNDRSKSQLFAKRDYELEDLDYINKSAYFDYQREKVYVKTHKNIRRIASADRARERRSVRPSRTIDLTCKKCPECGAKNLQQTTYECRNLLDLRFTTSGVKRSITCYRCWSYICSKCKSVFKARRRFAKQQAYGDSLMSWSVYLNVVCGLNMLRVQKTLKDLFDISLPNTQIYRFKKYIAARYSSLDDELLRSIGNGAVIHIDETECVHVI